MLDSWHGSNALALPRLTANNDSVELHHICLAPLFFERDWLAPLSTISQDRDISNKNNFTETPSLKLTKNNRRNKVERFTFAMNIKGD